MKRTLLALGVSAAALSSPALAQTSLERFERQLDQIQREQRMLANPEVPAAQRALVDYGGYLSLNFFAIDDVQQDTHILRQYDLVGYFRLNVDNVHEVFVRARTGYRDFNPGDSFDGEGDETTWPTIEQAYYRFDLARCLSAYKGKNVDYNAIFQGGRQFVYWGNGLVLGQTLDGATLDLRAGNVSLLLLGGVTDHKTVDFDSSRPQFDDHTERLFYGAMLSAQLGKHRPYLYFLNQRDHNPDYVLDVGGFDTHFDYDSWYIGGGINGSLSDRLLYATEFVYEGGRSLSNSFDPATLTPVTQQTDDIQAAAADIRLDYLLNDPHRTRLTLETVVATGDPDRLNSSETFGGNRPGTDDHAFNAWGIVNTGLAFGPSVSNIIVGRLGASTFPFGNSGIWRRFQVGTDLLLFAKFREDAPIDEPTTSDRFLGFEPDVYMNWQITSDITFTLRYGVFFPGSGIVNDEHPRNFFFAGMTFSF